MIAHSRKILSLLDPDTRRKIVWLSLLMLGLAALETVGVGMVLPLLQILVDPGQLQSQAWLNRLYVLTGSPGQLTFLAYFASTMVVFIIIKNAALVGLTYLQSRFTFDKHAEFSIRLYRHYLDRPYAVNMRRNSAEIVRDISYSAYTVFGNGLLPLLNILLECLVVAAVAGFLLMVEPVGTLVIMIALGILVVLYHKVSSPWASSCGAGLRETQASIVAAIMDGATGLKEVKAGNAEPHFESLFRVQANRAAHFRLMVTVLQQVPRPYLESAAMAVLVGTAALLVSRNGLESVIPTLGLFGAVAMRLIPSANRIVSYANLVKLGAAAVDALHDDLVVASAGGAVHLPHFEHAIRFDGVHLTYPGQDVSALRGISLEIRKGEAMALCGPSGAGKTSLVDVLLGLLPPDRGTVLFDGHPSGQQAGRTRVNYVAQNIRLQDCSLRANVAFGEADEAIDDDRILAALRMAGLEQVVADLPEGLNTRLGEGGGRLSGGQRQRVAIARALYRDAELIVLDEATSALDPESEAAIRATLAGIKGKVTLVVVAHRMSVVRGCDRVAFIIDGQVADMGTYEDLIQRNAAFRAFVAAAEEPVGNGVTG